MIRGAVDGGAEVLDIGMVGTEMLYFAVGSLDLDGGICCHRLAQPEAVHRASRSCARARSRSAATPASPRCATARSRASATPAERGKVESYDIWPAFVDRVLSFIDVDAIQPLRIVIDAANGMGGKMMEPVLERLPQLDVVRCCFEPDGTFPDHEPNPLLPENREFIIAQGHARRAPSSGSPSTATPTAASSSTTPATSSPATSSPRSSPSRCSSGSRARRSSTTSAPRWAVPRTVEAAGGAALVNRVGHAFIKPRMREDGAAFGGEVSGHYYFRDFSQADTGVVPALLMLELLSKRGKKLSELVGRFRSRVLHHRRDQLAASTTSRSSCSS